MNNTLGALNNYLFEAIERLNDDSLSEDELEIEMRKAKAVNDIGKTIIANGQLALAALKFNDEKNDMEAQTPKMLSGEING